MIGRRDIIPVSSSPMGALGMVHCTLAFLGWRAPEKIVFVDTFGCVPSDFAEPPNREDSHSRASSRDPERRLPTAYPRRHQEYEHYTSKDWGKNPRAASRPASAGDGG